MRSLPITHRAKNSPLKEADAFLVKNDAQVNPQFVDVAESYAKGRAAGKSQTTAKQPQRKPELKTTETPPPDTSKINGGATQTVKVPTK